MEKVQEIENLKKLANEYFASKKYFEAEQAYDSALQELQVLLSSKEENDTTVSLSELKAVLLANRSAARLGLQKFDLALQDAEESITANPTWIKGYYRKAATLEAMGKFMSAIETWENARSHFITPTVFNGSTTAAPSMASPSPSAKEDLAVIDRQVGQLKKRWSQIFYSSLCPIESEIDLLTRFSCLSDKRERLSTLAHFWNDSNTDERFNYFQALIQLIGGEGDLSEKSQEEITSEIMVPMPMQNYPDLPRERVEVWCNFFQSLDAEKKSLVFQAIWNKLLSSEEKNDIIMDLKLLFSQSIDALSHTSIHSPSAADEID